MEERQINAEKSTVGLCVMALGIIAGILFIVAAFVLYGHGQNLANLRSVASQTGDASIMEIYYDKTAVCLL